MRRLHKIATISTFIAIGLLTAGCSQPKATPKVAPFVKKAAPKEYIYSSSKVEYADVNSIERLKKATVILIEKVDNFEKLLSKKNISKQDLANLSNKLNKKSEDRIATLKIIISGLRKVIKQNSTDIARLSNNKKINKEVSSKYDKKIMEFLNKQKN